MSEFKDTEAGKIPLDWIIHTIDELKSPKKYAIAMGPFGSNITKDNFIEKGIPVIRGNNLTHFIFNDSEFVFISEEKAKELKASICKRRDIIITHRGTLGQVGFIPENSNYNKYLVSQSGIKLTINDKITDSKFVFYFLKSPKGQYLLLRNVSQTGVPSIAQPSSSIKSIPIPLPPKNEIHEIVKTLDSIQIKIDLLRRQNETLERIAQTLFKRWFVEFEFPDENGRPYKSSGGKMVPSELGEIPEGWKIRKLGNEFKIIMGQSPPGKSYNEDEDGIIFFQGRSDFGFRYPIVRLYTTQSKRIAEKLDVLVSVRAPVGDVNVAFEKCCIGRGLSAVRSKYMGYCLYKIKSLNKVFKQYEKEGTVFGSMNKESFNNITTVFPKEEIVKEFENTIKSIDDKIFTNEKKIRNLINIRDSILPKLMSGKIRIPDK